MIQETFEDFFHPDGGEDLLVEPLSIEDVFGVPDRRGLGVELDEEVLREQGITRARAP